MFGISGGRRDIAGIDFSSNTLKIAQMRVYPNKKEIVNLLTRDISGVPDAEMPKIIRAAFNELSLKACGIINTISANLVMTKNIEIPSLDSGEIKEIINLQAPRHTPYSREEIVVDYINIGTYKRSYTKILLVIVPRSVLKRQYEILEKAGLKLERALFAPEGLAWAAPRILKAATEDAPAGIVHIDEWFTDFSIVFKNKVIFIRSIPIGARNLSDEKERYEKKFLEEIKRSLEAYQTEEIEKNPNTLIVTGAIEELKDLEALLNNNLQIPARMAPYIRNAAFSDRARKALSNIKYSSFLNVIASLIGREEMKVSLVPEEIKIRKALEERGRELIKTGILTLTLFILVFSILINKIYWAGLKLKELDGRYQALNQDAEKLEKDFAKVSAIRNYLSNRGYSLEVLTELHGIAPFDLELNDIRFDRQGKFSVRGTAETMSAVFSFLDNLKQSKYFKDAKARHTTKRKDGLRDVADFEINALLNKEAGE